MLAILYICLEALAFSSLDVTLSAKASVNVFLKFAILLVRETSASACAILLIWIGLKYQEQPFLRQSISFDNGFSKPTISWISIINKILFGAPNIVKKSDKHVEIGFYLAI